MLIMLFINLYTVRVILNTLGVVDYGIYNVVAGFVASFSFLANTTASAIQRFLSYSLGQKRYDEYQKYFSNSFILFIIIALIAILLLQTFGMWFLQHKMVIPSERLSTAIWVFQFSTITLFFSFISIPYNAVILSNEKMNVFAYISIFDVINKLLIVYLLVIIPFESLKTYATLLSCIEFINFILYRYFAKRVCKFAKISIMPNFKYIKHLIGFTGWNLIGSLAGLCRNQGLNILINIFYGPIYNAACGIAFQIYNAVNRFATNFMMAVNPQIIKLYATGNTYELEKLIERSSKLSFSLLMLISFPLFILMPEILNLWLKDVPNTTVLFSRLILINMLIECISLPLLTLAQATGRLKIYQSVVGGFLILTLPISWITLKFLHSEAYTIFVILIIFNVIALFSRILILNKTAGLPIVSFFKNVISRWGILIVIGFLGIHVSLQLHFFLRILFTIVSTCFLLPLTIYFVEFNSLERKAIYQFIKNKIKL